MDHDQAPPSPPVHVLIFPLPLQGPIKCMLKLAELLCLAGDIEVTFLNTHHNHSCLLHSTAVESRFSVYPHFRFQTISDGLPDDHPRSVDRWAELVNGLWTVTSLNFKEMLNSGCGGERPPVTCVIADGVLDFALDCAEEVGIPLFYFETISPCGLWTLSCVNKLVEAGEIPWEGDDLDAPIQSFPGMEGFLRRRDLPSFCRAKGMNDPNFSLAMGECRQVPRSRGLILNTFEELDGPVLSEMRSMCPNLYPVGPLHIHLKTRLETQSKPPPESSDSLWKEDKSCITWLDAQPSRSVIYVSIGSQAMMSMEQLMELWHGLVNSGVRFLWVRRANSIVGDDTGGQIQEELLKATKERGCLVGWAPQEEVLAHPAIGGFLTHSGWNSTLESLIEEVPMICWPYFYDQQVNSRFVSEVWKIGVDIKDTCDRKVTEKMVKDLMSAKGDDFRQSMVRLSKLARRSISLGGSSVFNLNRLIDDIRSLKV